MRVWALVPLLPLVLTACRGEHTKTVTIAEGYRVEMSLSDLMSLQSDWKRYLTISDEEQSIRIELLSDTGWWRGSSLYIHKSGAYVLNEGQGGCVVFQTSPLQILKDHSNLCDRMAVASEQSGLSFTSIRCTRSRHYSDLCFLGLFFEAEDLANVMEFNWSDAQREPLLPTPP